MTMIWHGSLKVCYVMGLVLDRFVRLTYFIDTFLDRLLWNLFRIIEIKATRLIKYLNYLLYDTSVFETNVFIVLLMYEEPQTAIDISIVFFMRGEKDLCCL